MLRYKRTPPDPGRAKRQARAPSPQLTLISLSCHLNCDSSACAHGSYPNLVPVFDTQPASILETVRDRHPGLRLHRFSSPVSLTFYL